MLETLAPGPFLIDDTGARAVELDSQRSVVKVILFVHENQKPVWYVSQPEDKFSLNRRDVSKWAYTSIASRALNKDDLVEFFANVQSKWSAS